MAHLMFLQKKNVDTLAMSICLDTPTNCHRRCHSHMWCKDAVMIPVVMTSSTNACSACSGLKSFSDLRIGADQLVL